MKTIYDTKHFSYIEDENGVKIIYYKHLSKTEQTSLNNKEAIRRIDLLERFLKGIDKEIEKTKTE